MKKKIMRKKIFVMVCLCVVLVSVSGCGDFAKKLLGELRDGEIRIGGRDLVDRRNFMDKEDILELSNDPNQPIEDRVDALVSVGCVDEARKLAKAEGKKNGVKEYLYLSDFINQWEEKFVRNKFLRKGKSKRRER